MKRLFIIMVLILTTLYSSDMVEDKDTGIMWQDSSDIVQKSWSEAKLYCDNLTLGGYDDWRLPHIDELMSITDKSKYNLAIKEIFTNTKSNYYWSNTEYANDKTQAWIVGFDYGGDGWGNKADSGFVRCVR